MYAFAKNFIYSFGIQDDRSTCMPYSLPSQPFQITTPVPIIALLVCGMCHPLCVHMYVLCTMYVPYCLE